MCVGFPARGRVSFINVCKSRGGAVGFNLGTKPAAERQRHPLLIHLSKTWESMNLRALMSKFGHFFKALSWKPISTAIEDYETLHIHILNLNSKGKICQSRPASKRCLNPQCLPSRVNMWWLPQAWDICTPPKSNTEPIGWKLWIIACSKNDLSMTIKYPF